MWCEDAILPECINSLLLVIKIASGGGFCNLLGIIFNLCGSYVVKRKEKSHREGNYISQP
jgi:hypothetical protein